MKKTWMAMMGAAAMTVAFAAGTMAAEEKADQAQEENSAVFSTIRQAREEGEFTGVSSWDTNDHYITVVEYEGRIIRVVADLDEKAAAKRDECYGMEDFFEGDEKLGELAESLDVSYTEDLTDAIPDQTEIDALVGKTLGEIEEEGYEESSHGEDGEKVVFTMIYGMFAYDLEMNESVEEYQKMAETDDFSSLTVRTAAFAGVSYNASDLAYHADGTYVPEESGDAFFFELMESMPSS